MRRTLGILMIFGMILPALMFTPALVTKVTAEPKEITRIVEKEEFVKIADNFVVLYDASASMGEMYRDTGMKKIDVAEKILKDRNATLPDLGYDAGLYLFTPFRPFYAVKAYDRAEYGSALDSLPSIEDVSQVQGQATPLTEGIFELDSILSGLRGRTVVFLFSDGQYTPSSSLRVERRHPLVAAKEIASKHDVCFFLISSAETAKEKKLLDDIAAVNECSRVVSFDEVYDKPEYIPGVLYIIKKKQIMEIIGIRVEDVLFEFDGNRIRPEFNEELNALGTFLQKNPKAYVTLEGYADSVGSQEYNLKLSRRRAERVRDYLMENFNIGEDRIVLHWYGKENPAASNDTPEGRQKNRRVVFDVAGLE